MKEGAVGHSLTSTNIFQTHKQIKSEISNQMTSPHSLLSGIQLFSSIFIFFLYFVFSLNKSLPS